MGVEHTRARFSSWYAINGSRSPSAIPVNLRLWAAAYHPAEAIPHGGRSQLVWRIMTKSCLALLKSRFRYRPYQLENVRECVPLPLDIRRLHSSKIFLNENISSDDSKTIKKRKDAIR